MSKSDTRANLIRFMEDHKVTLEIARAESNTSWPVTLGKDLVHWRAKMLHRNQHVCTFPVSFTKAPFGETPPSDALALELFACDLRDVIAAADASEWLTQVGIDPADQAAEKWMRAWDGVAGMYDSMVEILGLETVNSLVDLVSSPENAPSPVLQPMENLVSTPFV